MTAGHPPFPTEPYNMQLAASGTQPAVHAQICGLPFGCIDVSALASLELSANDIRENVKRYVKHAILKEHGDVPIGRVGVIRLLEALQSARDASAEDSEEPTTTAAATDNYSILHRLKSAAEPRTQQPGPELAAAAAAAVDPRPLCKTCNKNACKLNCIRNGKEYYRSICSQCIYAAEKEKGRKPDADRLSSSSNSKPKSRGGFLLLAAEENPWNLSFINHEARSYKRLSRNERDQVASNEAISIAREAIKRRQAHEIPINYAKRLGHNLKKDSIAKLITEQLSGEAEATEFVQTYKTGSKANRHTKRLSRTHLLAQKEDLTPAEELTLNRSVGKFFDPRYDAGSNADSEAMHDLRQLHNQHKADQKNKNRSPAAAVCSSEAIDARRSQIPAETDISKLLSTAFPAATAAAVQFYAAKFSDAFAKLYISAAKGLAQQCPNCSIGLLSACIALHAESKHEELLRVVHALVVKVREGQIGSCLNNVTQQVVRTGYELESIDSFVARPDFKKQCQQQCVAMQEVVAVLCHENPTLAADSGLHFNLLDNIDINDEQECTALILRCSRALSPDNPRLDATGLFESEHWYARMYECLVCVL